MLQKGGMHAVAICIFLFGISVEASAVPLFSHMLPEATPLKAVPVVVFGNNSRRSVEEFAAEQKLDAAELRSRFAGSGLIECGDAHGAGQLTLANDVVTTAAHVFFDERGALRAKTCFFSIENDGKETRVPIDLGSIVAGSTDPYAIEPVHDWAVARLTHPIDGVIPYSLADVARPNVPVQFVARGHIDLGDGRRLSMEKCLLHDQLSSGVDGTREFSFDCETGDVASGGALVVGSKGQVDLGSIIAGSTNPYSIAPIHDWAVARWTYPIEGVTPYGLADVARPNVPVEFVARGHIDWGDGRRLSMEKCLLHDQLPSSAEKTGQFSLDCEIGDGASGGAFVIGTKVPMDLGSTVAGSTYPSAIAAVHEFAVSRLAHPVKGVTPYADAARFNAPVEFVARGHIDWGDGRKLSMEKCVLHDQLSVGAEGTREFSFDCETGDGASGGALVMTPDEPTIGAILVGWRSNRPFRSAPFSQSHYNFAVTIEGAFRKAVVAAASKVVVAK